MASSLWIPRLYTLWLQDFSWSLDLACTGKRPPARGEGTKKKIGVSEKMLDRNISFSLSSHLTNYRSRRDGEGGREEEGGGRKKLGWYRKTSTFQYLKFGKDYPAAY